MEVIEKFLKIQYNFGSGYGYGSGDGSEYGSSSGSGSSSSSGSGYGSGDGYGDGSGYGYGDGSGSGSGDGSGSGSGDGSGSGSGLKVLNNQKIYLIDNLQTIITKVKNNIATGFIVNQDLTLTACYIIKEDNYFSHGSTLKEAFNSLKEKIYQNYPLEERILKFKEQFSDFNKKYKGSDLFIWHNILTGSCKMGRESWIKNHNININSKFTIYEFIELTKNEYGGENIKQLLD